MDLEEGGAIDQQDQSVESGLLSKGTMWIGDRVTFAISIWGLSKTLQCVKLPSSAWWAPILLDSFTQVKSSDQSQIPK